MTREEAIKKLLEEHCGYGDGDCDRCKFKCEIYMAIEALQERPKGRWVDSFDGITPFCTNCGRTHKCIDRTPDYCPNCGSDNRGEEE